MSGRTAPSLPGLIRQSIILRKTMDARVKPAHGKLHLPALNKSPYLNEC
jgi:hypothetical protein